MVFLWTRFGNQVTSLAMEFELDPFKALVEPFIHFTRKHLVSTRLIVVRMHWIVDDFSLIVTKNVHISGNSEIGFTEFSSSLGLNLWQMTTVKRCSLYNGMP